MKRIYFSLLAVVLLMCQCGKLNDVSEEEEVQVETIEEKAFDGGVLPGVFSVADGVTVQFSQGNLQYRAADGIWRFASHQYDVEGEANAAISATDEDWIDLFGWGTSGWESGAICYQPYSVSNNFTDYYVGGAVENDLRGDYANADWGVYNAISNGGNVAGVWRTLSGAEWKYLLTERDSASSLYSIGTVDDIKGLLLLPDGGVDIEGVNFKPQAYTWVDNNYELKDWVKLHEAGVVFLPTTGLRGGDEVQNVVNMGCYWTSSSIDEYCAMALSFNGDGVNAEDRGVRFYGRAVRLVK